MPKIVTKAELAAKGGVSIKFAAEHLSVSTDTIYRLMADGKLAWFRVSRVRRIPRVALDQYIIDRMHAPHAL